MENCDRETLFPDLRRRSGAKAIAASTPQAHGASLTMAHSPAELIPSCQIRCLKQAATVIPWVLSPVMPRRHGRCGGEPRLRIRRLRVESAVGHAQARRAAEDPVPLTPKEAAIAGAWSMTAILRWWRIIVTAQPTRPRVQGDADLAHGLPRAQVCRRPAPSAVSRGPQPPPRAGLPLVVIFRAFDPFAPHWRRLPG